MENSSVSVEYSTSRLSQYYILHNALFRFSSLIRFGKGFTLHVKIGSPEDFIGAVSEHVLVRGRSNASQRGGSILGSRFFTRQTQDEPSSPVLRRPRAASSPVNSYVASNTEPLLQHVETPAAILNFHNFIKENFESSTLLEEHQVFDLHA